MLAVVAGGAVAAVTLLRSAGAPADRAARLVPADALAYVHVSTDPGRGEDRRLLRQLSGFPAVAALRERFERLISSRAGGFDLDRDVRPWLGDEAGLALLDSGGPAANVLLVLAVRDEPKAQGQLLRAAGASGGIDHRGIAVRRFGGVAAAFVGGFLALGQEAAVKAAVDCHREGENAPCLGPAAGQPADRALDVRLSRDGVRRVLRPQAGALGALGALLDHPAMERVTVSLVPEESGIRIVARQDRNAEAFRTEPFSPELIESVPKGALAYVGLGGLQPAGVLLGAAGGTAVVERLQGLVPDIAIARDLVGPLRGEVALSVTPSLPAPTITLIARTRDEARTREALGELRGAVAELLSPAGAADGGQVPTFEERRLGKVTAYALSLGPGSEVLYAVFDGRLVVSTAAAGIQRVADGGASLRGDPRFDRTTELPDSAEAVLFLDLAQLLTLGEQAGLDPTALQPIRDDLRRVRVLSAVARRDGPDTTAELFLEIP